MKGFLVIFIFAFCVVKSFSLDSLRSQQDWKLIESKHSRIIFPKETRLDAQKLITNFDTYLPQSGKLLGVKSRRLTVVLNNTTSFANGFYSLTPNYAEVFTFAENFGTSSDWLSLLATHEGHHFVQFEKLQEGSKFVWYFFLGGTGSAIMSAFYVPIWFFEGNATVFESLVSHSGRGQHPIFLLSLRAKELYKKRTSYYSTYLRHPLLPLTEDHYDLGYLISSYIQYEYPKYIWDKVLSSLNEYIIFPTFNYSLKQHTGKGIEELYHEALDFYQERWKKQIESLPVDSKLKTFVSAEDRENWNAFISPQYLQDGTLLSLSVGTSYCSELIEIDSFYKPARLIPLTEISRGISVTAAETGGQVLSSGGRKVVWIDKASHRHEQNQVYSNIWLYDFDTDSKSQIRKSSRYSNVVLSSDGKQLLAIYKGYEGQVEFHLYVTETLQQKDKIKVPFGWNVYDLAWNQGENKIVFTSIFGENGVSLKEYDLIEKTFNDLIPSVKGIAIRTPSYWNDYVIFQSDMSGLDQIYAIHSKTKKSYQLTFRQLGAFFPAIHPFKNILVFSDYGINGFSLLEFSLDKENWVEVKGDFSREKDPVLQKIIEKSFSTNFSDRSGAYSNKKEYKIEEYNSISHIFHPHSWVFFANSENTLSLKTLYASVSFTDYLSTMLTNLSYLKLDSRYFLLGDLTYLNYYPDFFVRGRREVGGAKGFGYFDVGVRLPLDFSQGKLFSHTFSSEFSLRFLSKKNFSLKTSGNWSFIKQKKTPLSLYPIGFSISHAIIYDFADNIDFENIEFVFKAFFPGFTAIQGWRLVSCFSIESAFNNCIGRTTFKIKEENSLNSLNYGLNLFYLDFSLLSVLYLKQLNFEFFTEYENFREENDENNRKVFSVGGDFKLLFHPFSNIIPAQMIITIGYDFLNKDNFINRDRSTSVFLNSKVNIGF